jgi:hypothetical protein
MTAIVEPNLMRDDRRPSADFSPEPPFLGSSRCSRDRTKETDGCVSGLLPNGQTQRMIPP